MSDALLRRVIEYMASDVEPNEEDRQAAKRVMTKLRAAGWVGPDPDDQPDGSGFSRNEIKRLEAESAQARAEGRVLGCPECEAGAHKPGAAHDP